MNTADN